MVCWQACIKPDQVFYPELHQKFYGGHLWSPSYFAKSTGNCSDEIIQKYINTQWERPFK